MLLSEAAGNQIRIASQRRCVSPCHSFANQADCLIAQGKRSIVISPRGEHPFNRRYHSMFSVCALPRQVSLCHNPSPPIQLPFLEHQASYC